MNSSIFNLTSIYLFFKEELLKITVHSEFVDEILSKLKRILCESVNFFFAVENSFQSITAFICILE